MTQQTILAHFDSRSDARQAAQALTQVGIGQSERRPAHRPLLTGDENLFQERTIEAEERGTPSSDRPWRGSVFAWSRHDTNTG